MSKNIIFDSWDYLDNPDDLADAWSFERKLLSEYFQQTAANQNVVMYGTIGRWDGNYPGGKAGVFDELLSELMQYADDVQIYDENGHLFIRTADHDGVSNFEIKALTPKGYDVLENFNYGLAPWCNLSDRQLHEKLMSSSHYTHLPRYAKWLHQKSA